MTFGGYLRFEVGYASPTAPGRHVWGWASTKKEVDALLRGLANNPQLQHIDMIDRERVTKLDKAASTAQAERPRAGLFL